MVNWVLKTNYLPTQLSTFALVTLVTFVTLVTLVTLVTFVTAFLLFQLSVKLDEDGDEERLTGEERVEVRAQLSLISTG